MLTSLLMLLGRFTGWQGSRSCWQPSGSLLWQPAVASRHPGALGRLGWLGRRFRPPLTRRCCTIPACCSIDPVLAAHTAAKHVKGLNERLQFSPLCMFKRALQA